MPTQPTVLLGSVAIEPARWAAHRRLHDDAAPPAPIALSAWLDRIAEAGFDGVELWERHLTDASPSEEELLVGSNLEIPVFNSYVSLDDADQTNRAAVSAAAQLTSSTGIKFNVGNDPTRQSQYAERIATWLEGLPTSVALLCECHHGISIAEDPGVASAIFDAAGPASRLQAIVHTHESADHIRERFDAYGNRITHVHVNFLDFETMSAPRLSDIRGRVESQVALLRDLGFAGSWTIEFTNGVLTENDHPDYLLAQAADDLAVLREVLT